MAEIAPWQSDVTLRQIQAHLAAGECVALATESTYELVASALCEAGVARLRALDGEQVPAVVLTDIAEVADWLPLLRGAGARVIRKLGAGPYVLKANVLFHTGLFQRLPPFAQEALAASGGLRIRLPDQPIWRELRQLGLPLLSVPIPGGVDASTAAKSAGDHAARIVEGGAGQFIVPPSVIEVDGRRAKMVREGGLTREQFDEIARCRVLFVCTGNTCRSPMAEALCVKLLAEHFGCPPAELGLRGYAVQSAGLAAMNGSDASSEAVEVVASLGGDLARHRSSMATVDMLLWADHIFAMTSGHWQALRSVDLPNVAMPQMLSPHYDDIADPIGRAMIDYQSCAQQILDCLQQRLPQILES